MATRDNSALEPFASLEFGVKWERPASAFSSSLKAVFTGPKPPEWTEALQSDSPMRVTWIRNGLPGRAITASSLWHVAFVLILLLPIWKLLRLEPRNIVAPDMKISWDLPAPDLPPLSSTLKPISPVTANDPPPNTGSDAYHPRQTILSIPERVTHPRQTLIQPDAPPDAPKIVPPLPNIAQWGEATPVAPPKLQIAPSELKPILRNAREDAADAPQIRNAAAHPNSLNLAQANAPDLKMPASQSAAPVFRARRAEDAAVPEIENRAPDSGALNIAASPSVPRPRLQVTASAARLAPAKATNADVAAAPEISSARARAGSSAAGGEASGGDANLRRIIALSTSPAPPSPSVEIPSGNLAARISISPQGNHANASGAGASANSGKAAAGPPGIYISTPRSNSGSAAAGSGSPANGGIRPAAPRLGAAASIKPALPPANSESTAPSGPRDLSGLDGEITPEKILSGKRIYTAYINLPNLTSARGSWILNFAELQPSGSPTHVHTDLAAPTVLLTVDPKYPETLIKQHVEGEVILYAIIRENGSVDSIQAVKRLDPLLDRNAIEAVAAWKFSPASRNGQPVAVEAVIHIPFHAPPAP